MKNQVLTKEQMEELIALGVDVSKASMAYYRNDGVTFELMINTFDPSVITDYPTWIVPAFTVTDILDMMPSEINGHDFTVYKSNEGWFAGYINYESSKLLYNLCTKCSILRDAVYLIFKELAIMDKLVEK